MANSTGKFGFRSFVVIICTDVVLCFISFGLKVWLVGSNANAPRILHSWVIVPIVLVTLAAIIQLVRMAKANKWGCLPTVFFMLSMAAIWLIPIGR
ncbi:KinB-signaling pathway activation protein [Streptomyces caniscabiei]|uniref:KinB-signaling pathway activation protein n=1 Tax=Streptomyces caniscabiei TaxID=2746961 RepID=UPI0029AF69F8|nr:KinB-signaling pathway activation protein [Streptomyces caniscabiei]MDX2775771.1 KinB-signaling pathway activation protein [Streptomyces caniscabiei]